jgi:hypothetical protein
MRFGAMVMILYTLSLPNLPGKLEMTVNNPPPDSGSICSRFVFQNLEENLLIQITQDYYLESVVTAFHSMVE